MESKTEINGRQLIACFRDSSRPCVMMSHKGQVVFANPAAAELVGCTLEQLVGITVNGFAESESKGSDGQSLPYLAEIEAWALGTGVLQGSGGELIQAANPKNGFNHWVAIEVGDNRTRRMVLFLAVKDSDNLMQAFQPSTTWKADREIQQYLQSLNAQQYALNKLLSIAGPQSESRLAMRQTQLAIESHVPVLVAGPVGSGKHRLAEAILYHRRRTAEVTDPPVVISCRVIDLGFLREINELLSERVRAAQQHSLPAPSVLFDRLELLPEECVVPMLSIIKESMSLSMVATIAQGTTCESGVGQARRELLNSLSTLKICLSPMRDRAADMPVLLQQLLHELSKNAKRVSLPTVSTQVRQILTEYPWPGDLDEFVAAIEHSVNSSQGQEIDVSHLPISIRTYPSSQLANENPVAVDLEQILLQTERQLIEGTLAQFPRNRAAAARALGISRTKLFRRMQALGMGDTDGLHVGEFDTDEEQSPKARQSRKKEPLTTEQIVQLAVDEGDELPEFRELSDDE